ncbi:MAG: flagellar basal body-associated FliL family protein [Chloroflexi bacterium]|nr:flagellar basal body-associated FliL family protein [Chloroflexota bacterium]
MFPKKWMLFAVVAVALGVGALTLTLDPFGAKAALAKKAEGQGAHAPAEDSAHGESTARGLMYSTKERVVNLADPGGFRYLKVEVVLELGVPAKELEGLKGEGYKKKQEELAKEMAPVAPVIDDAITAHLSSRLASELLTASGKATLREELKERLAPLVHSHPLKGIYLTQFIIQ